MFLELDCFRVQLLISWANDLTVFSSFGNSSRTRLLLDVVQCMHALMALLHIESGEVIYLQSTLGMYRRSVCILPG